MNPRLIIALGIMYTLVGFCAGLALGLTLALLGVI